MSADPIDQIRAILAEHGVDFDRLTVGRSDDDGEACLYTGRNETEEVDADYRPLPDVLRDLIALHREEPTDE